MMAFFTPKANDIVGTVCDSLVASLENPDPKQFSEQIKAVVGNTHIFQFHYNTSGKQGPSDFIFNEILDKPEVPKQLEAKASGSTSEEQQYEDIEYEKNTEPPLPSVAETVTPTEPTIMEVAERTSTQQEHSEEMATPPSAYTCMQTRSKTEASSENTRKTTKRQLFTKESSDNKKKKT